MARTTSSTSRAGRANGFFGACAGLEVLDPEPPSPDNPLLRLPTVVLSDHTAWYSVESVADLQRKAAEEMVRILSGERPAHWVNPWPEAATEHMRARSAGTE